MRFSVFPNVCPLSFSLEAIGPTGTYEGLVLDVVS